MDLDGKLDDSGLAVILFPDHYDSRGPQGRAGGDCVCVPAKPSAVSRSPEKKQQPLDREGSVSQASASTGNRHDLVSQRLVKDT